jgi:hypothetical protein
MPGDSCEKRVNAWFGGNESKDLSGQPVGFATNTDKPAMPTVM